MPSLIFLVFGTTNVILDTYRGLYNQAFVQIWITALVTFLLNVLCQHDMSFATTTKDEEHSPRPFESSNREEITDPLENSQENSERHTTLLVKDAGKREVTQIVNSQKQDAEEEAKALLLLRKSRQ